MKKLFLIGMLLSLAVSAFAQGTNGDLYFNKETQKWTYRDNTDSSEIRRHAKLCFGDGVPFAASATSGSAVITAVSTTSRMMYCVIQATSGASSTINGIVPLDYKMLFTDTLKRWFSNRALANDTCIMFVSQRIVSGSTVRCSLFIYNYGANLIDTLFRCAMPTTASAAPDTTIITFETACKDSNSLWPLKFSNGYFMPCLYYQIKAATGNSTANEYHIYNFRVLTNWVNH